MSVEIAGQFTLTIDSIVILNGLNDHPRHSLTSDGSGETRSMWLEELLPQRIPSARVMLFAYESHSTGDKNLLSAEGLNYAAEALLATLISNRVYAQVSPVDPA